MDKISLVKKEFEDSIAQLTSPESWQNVETEYLGRNGKVNGLMKDIKTVANDEKKEFGAKLNELKKEIEQKLAYKKKLLLAEVDSMSNVDVTLPGTQYPKGSLHVTTLAIEEISKIFEKIGFIRTSYPEIDWEHFAFETLNMPSDHPARDDFETFFVGAPAHKEFGRMVLTPHTSNGQNREMLRLEGKPPVRAINIGRTYRPNWDVSHTPMFHQFEGICIDEGINITHLKGTIDYFAKSFFGEEREIRLRPYHFQFTEPSFEVDITCGVCNGTGILRQAQDNLSTSLEIKCKLCKSGWLELGGSGMMHPNVLKAGGVDPEKYSGWAFGFGVERCFAMKEAFKLDDIRVLYSGDIRFLEQF